MQAMQAADGTESRESESRTRRACNKKRKRGTMTKPKCIEYQEADVTKDLVVEVLVSSVKKGTWQLYPEEIQEQFRNAAGGTTFTYHLLEDHSWWYQINKLEKPEQDDADDARPIIGWQVNEETNKKRPIRQHLRTQLADDAVTLLS